MSGGALPADQSTRPAASLVLNNNRDGSYEDIAERLGLQLADFTVGTVIQDDFDNDHDLDMIAFPALGGKTLAWANDRVWRYHLPGVEATGLDVERVVGATSADVNKDGWQDLLVFADSQLHLFLNHGRFRFVRDETFASQFSALGGTNGQAVDVDNDGDLDLLIADARREGSRGPVLLLNERRHRQVPQCGRRRSRLCSQCRPDQRRRGVPVGRFYWQRMLRPPPAAQRRGAGSV